MSFHAGEAWSWAQLRAAMQGQRHRTDDGSGDGNDAPAWSSKRDGYQRPAELAAHQVTEDGTAGSERVPYAELHCHSNFSFLDGASHPEQLVEQAAKLGLDAIALTDHDGMYGVVRFAEAARDLGVRTVFGAELSLGLPAPQAGEADPVGEHLLVLARDPAGYAALCRVMTSAHLRGGEKGRPVYDLDEVVGELRGQIVLTGCRKGAVRTALAAEGPDAGFAQLQWLVDRFGAEHVVVELTDHQNPVDSTRNDLLAELAAALELPTIATQAAHYATPDQGRLAAAMAATRARRSLDELNGWLPGGPMAYLRSGADQASRFRR